MAQIEITIYCLSTQKQPSTMQTFLIPDRGQLSFVLPKLINLALCAKLPLITNRKLHYAQQLCHAILGIKIIVLYRRTFIILYNIIEISKKNCMQIIGYVFGVQCQLGGKLFS